MWTVLGALRFQSGQFEHERHAATMLLFIEDIGVLKGNIMCGFGRETVCAPRARIRGAWPSMECASERGGPWLFLKPQLASQC